MAVSDNTSDESLAESKVPIKKNMYTVNYNECNNGLEVK